MVSIIVATSKNRVIGVGNQLPWHLPKDLKFFHQTTHGAPVIMGSNTFVSIPATYRPLPNRTNIVLSRNHDKEYPGAKVAHTLDEALNLANAEGKDEIFIIGGGQVFASALPKADRVYLTIVDVELKNGEVFFPELDPKDWQIKELGRFEKDDKHAYGGIWYQYDRIKEES